MALVEATDKFGGTTAFSGGGGMWFPCNAVLRRAGSDDTFEQALTYFHAVVVGDRTPASCRKPMSAAAPHSSTIWKPTTFHVHVLLPWPDYFGRLPAHASTDAPYRRQATAGRSARAGRGLRPGPLDNERLGVAAPICDGRPCPDRPVPRRASASIRTRRCTTIRRSRTVFSDGAVVGAVVRRDGELVRSAPPWRPAGCGRLREQRRDAQTLREFRPFTRTAWCRATSGWRTKQRFGWVRAPI